MPTPPHTSRTIARSLTRGALAALVLTIAPSPSEHALAAAETYDVDPDTGYRMERYRAPVPDSVPGGVTLDTAAMRERVAAGTLVLVDVFPPKGMGADPLDGSWLISEPHATLAGATWLPEVGLGFPSDAHEAYFRRNLARLSNGDPATPMVFFCTADCWQSWNAARRAIEWGYSGVHWYPLGTDGWAEQGGELVEARPLNFLDDSLPGADGSATDGPFPASARISLVDDDGVELDIGTVRFGTLADADASASGTPDPGVPDHGTPDHARAIDVTLDGEAFADHFLSMRPFRCLDGASEWFCHLPYPYALDDTVTPDDLTDLEYRLLFIVKAADEFGIDAWNGIYYRLTPNADGGFDGALLEGDLNVLAAPPDDPDARPIDLSEFIDDEADRRRFPTLVIRP